MCARLRADMTRARWQAQFEAAREHEPVLSAYARIQDVIEALNLDSRVDFAARSESICALLRESHRYPSQFWSSVLLVVFCPMLLRLRAQIGDCVLESSDVDQAVIEGFLTTVRMQSNPTASGVLLTRIFRQTRRFVFRLINAERTRIRNQRLLEQLAPMLSSYEHWLHDASIRASLLEKVVLSSVSTDTVDQRLSERQCEMVTEAWLLQVPLRAYLCRSAHDAPVSEVTYQRVKRERSRIERKLRPLIRLRMEDLPPNESRLEA